MPPTDPPPDLVLTPLQGPGRTIEELLTVFHLLLIVLDPYTEESAWVLPPAQRVLHTFEQADCRVGIVIAADAPDARQFLGSLTRTVLTYCDPDRSVIRALGLERLPAIVHLDQSGAVAGSAEGWNPREWQQVCDRLARTMAWSAPAFGLPKDPGPFAGTPALA